MRRLNVVQRLCSNRTSRGELLATSPTHWFTTKLDGMWNYPLDAGTAPGTEEGKQLIELDLTHPHVVQRSSCLTNQSHDGE